MDQLICRGLLVVVIILVFVVFIFFVIFAGDFVGGVRIHCCLFVGVCLRI